MVLLFFNSLGCVFPFCLICFNCCMSLIASRVRKTVETTEQHWCNNLSRVVVFCFIISFTRLTTVKNDAKVSHADANKIAERLYSNFSINRLYADKTKMTAQMLPYTRKFNTLACRYSITSLWLVAKRISKIALSGKLR